MFDVILLMAGSGSRTGLSYNKVLYSVKNKPLFRYSLDQFLALPQCRKVILVAGERDFSAVEEATSDLDGDRIKIAIGGSRRRESVYNGLVLTESDLVLTHDAARPLIKKEDIIKVYEAANDGGFAVLAVKATDTIYRVRGDEMKILDRGELWHMQTPQAVARSALLAAYESDSPDLERTTDEVGLIIKKFDIKPIIVEGSHDNIKVTYERDLRFVEYMIERGYYGL